MNKRICGAENEEKAARYLAANGYDILERNFSSRYGEIDIIASDDKTLVFVEVKYRSSAAYGYPQEAVGYYKQQKLIKTARYYMYRRNIPDECSCRFDVVFICGDDITCIKNAFWT
ncbi:MAG: YraN family protein [Lachnospiraceae bacterium]|nr:YraN family protein [Lachnospiraceae bacterium]